MTLLSSPRASFVAVQPRSPLHAIGHFIKRNWGVARSGVLLSLPLVLAALTITFVVDAFRTEVTNHTIRALKSNHDVVVTADAPPQALLARIEFLLAHDRIDEIQLYVEAIDKKGPDSIRADAHYNFANGRLRQGFDQITASKLDEAGPYVVLARQEYRRALTYAPDRWDVKFNLDVASRLIRDFPAFERTIGDEVKTDRKKIWTDIPGKPEGLP